MNGQNSNWLHYINETVKNEKGSVILNDSSDDPIVLEWEKINGKSPRLTQKIQEVSAILAHTYTIQEIEFAKMNPELVPQEYFLKALTPLFEKGLKQVDWKTAEHHMLEVFTQVFTRSDFAQYASEQDISLFITIVDQKTNQLLGVNQFLITSEFEYGTLKSAYFGISHSAQNRGLEKLLMGWIFKLVPGTTRLFMHTRKTNKQLISLYQSWGFREFPGELENWVDLEYLAGTYDTLQNK